MRKVTRMRAVLALVMFLTVACGSATPGSVGSPLTVPQLQFRVLDAVGKPAWCDPDFYPLGHPEMPNAIAQYPAIKADTTTYAAILEHERLPSGNLSDEQKLTVYRAWKLLRPVRLAQDGDHYTFDYTVAGQTSYERVSGTVGVDGTVTVRSRAPGQRPNCPICLAAATLISTPSGPLRVTEVHVGTVVWTRAANGSRVAAPVIQVGSMEAPAGHLMVRVVLADGRQVLVSPGHKTTDGRAVGSLKAGDQLDGSTISGWELVPYTGGRTYDLLPAGATGHYWANGIVLSSTLVLSDQLLAEPAAVDLQTEAV